LYSSFGWNISLSRCQLSRIIKYSHQKKKIIVEGFSLCPVRKVNWKFPCYWFRHGHWANGSFVGRCLPLFQAFLFATVVRRDAVVLFMRNIDFWGVCTLYLVRLQPVSGRCH
jgi:hypothetical protein